VNDGNVLGDKKKAQIATCLDQQIYTVFSLRHGPAVGTICPADPAPLCSRCGALLACEAQAGSSRHPPTQIAIGLSGRALSSSSIVVAEVDFPGRSLSECSAAGESLNQHKQR
ncbi:hypothetical protein ElyMa_004685100, partial [Elysia marginata]